MGTEKRSSVMTDKDAVLALDIGGTKMASAVVARDGTMLARGEVPTRGGAEQLYAALVALCQEQLEAAGAPVAGVGVGCAGPMRYPDGIVSPINVIAWQEFPLGGRLRETFGLPTFVENDAKVMALGEHWLGGGRGVSNMLGMVVSTGVGGGLILDGRLVHGNAGNAGHVGHIIVWPDGPICPCGARGCLEAVAAGGALARRLAEMQAAGRPTRLGRAAQPAEIARAARAGDALACRLFEDAGTALGRAIASTAALCDIGLALLGGSVAVHAWDLLEPPLDAELGRAARLDFSRQVRVRQAVLGPDAGLLGAAASALSGLGK